MQSNRVFKFNFYSESKSTLIDQSIDRAINLSIKKQVPPQVIFTPNPEQIMLAQSDVEFASALHDADILIPDGIGLIIASRILSMFGKGQSLTQRISGIDLFQTLATQFPQQKMLVIGGRGEGDDVAAVRQLNVGNRSIPWITGYHDVRVPTKQEERAVELRIARERPAVIFVAFGAPYQEYWALRHKAFLEKHNVRVVLVVGGAVDVLSGKLKRAPKLLRSLGLEWLFRLIQEPWRWKRQLNLVHFISLTLKTALSD